MSFYRHPRTHQEAKANQEKWGRPRRCYLRLRNDYDDIIKTCYRTWKKYRYTQYRPK